MTLYFYHLHYCYLTETRSHHLPNIVALYEVLKKFITCSYNAVAFSALCNPQNLIYLPVLFQLSHFPDVNDCHDLPPKLCSA